VAAHLCNGVDLADLGEALDPGLLVPGVVPVSAREPDGLHAAVLWVDRFGNVQLNVDPADLPAGRVQVRIGERVRAAELVTAFDEVPPGGLGLLVDSAGLVSLVVARSSAAAELGIAGGDAVVLADLDGTESGVTTPVELGRSRAG
jgi:S-adenosylmethionine hydrolase